ncbi:MAG TPA: protease pro-enzyme activation domain-containing protein [Thermoplasmata archaeon]|nr:protease pro-enzyme activation domain-containing protein [Thermoplasmata archaeon]
MPGRRGAGAIAAAVLVAMLLVGPSPPGRADPTSSESVRASAWAVDIPLAPHGARLAALPGDRTLGLTLTLQPAQAAALDRLDRSLADPTSPEFGRFLSERQFEAAFSPAPGNVSQLERYLASYGASGFHVSPDRLGLSFSVRADGFDRAFSTSLGELRDPAGGEYRAASAPLTLPGELAHMVVGVSGLGDPGAVVRPPVAAAGTLPSLHRREAFLNGTAAVGGSPWFVGSDYVALYDETPLLPGGTTSRVNATYATSQAVATLLMSGYNASPNENLPPFDPAAIDRYFNATFPTAWPKPVVQGVPVPIAGITPPPPGPAAGRFDDSGDQIENSLDLEMAGSLAPGAEVVDFYFPASLQFATPNASTDRQIADDFSMDLANALSYNYTPRQLASVSASFGVSDLNDTLWNTELAHAAAIGVTVIAASGDSGNAPAPLTKQYLGAEPGWPASAAFETSGTLSVGGVSLAASGSASGSFDGVHPPNVSYDPATGLLQGQSAWYNALGGSGNVTGTEGGGATIYPEPDWQFHSAAQPNLASAEGIGKVPALCRAEPDLALAANDTIAFTPANAAGAVSYSLLQGTSVAAPLFAGMVAQWAAVEHHGLGYLDPILYRIASYYAAHPGPSDPFLDVTSGQNYLYRAAPGWDAATGWGGLDASRFLPAYENRSIAGYQYTGPTPGLPTPFDGVSVLGIVLIAAVGALLTGVVLAVVTLGRRSPSPPFRIAPSGFSAPPLPGAPGAVVASFDCPYCGRPRPAEAVRCPGCGRL